jgi:hypothetical protein
MPFPRINALRALGATLAVTVVAIPLAANAQTYQSNCWWEQGVYACNSRSETPYSTTTTLCAAGETSACVSRARQKQVKISHPASSETTQTGVTINRGGTVEWKNAIDAPSTPAR